MSSKKAVGVTVFTKFSVRFNGKLPTEEWIDSRFELLKKAALPSINQQTHQEFVWLIAAAPEWLDKTRALFQSADLRPGIQLVVAEKPFSDSLNESIHKECASFITANLDSDDTLHYTTIERLASLGPELQDRTLINMPEGLQLNWQTGEVMAINFHQSFQGPFRAAKHYNRAEMFNIGGGHVYSRDQFLHVHTLSDICWMRTIHGGNLVNRFPNFLNRLRSNLGLMPRDHFMSWKSVRKKDREELLRQCGVKI